MCLLRSDEGFGPTTEGTPAPSCTLFIVGREPTFHQACARGFSQRSKSIFCV